MTAPFLSPPPRDRLVKAFSDPVRNAVAAARTCYSARGIVGEDAAEDRERRMALAKSVFSAGHHTVFQHAHFQFAIENVSRQFLWTFLHAHPFYNSEQVSQRYVAVSENGVAVPRFARREAQAIYERCVRRQLEDYRRLRDLLMPAAEAAFHERFPRSPSQQTAHRRAIQRKAQEIARYALPIATHAYLYHTVSALTVFRYYRMARQLDAPAESLCVAEQMARELIRLDPDMEELLGRPLAPEEFPEDEWLRSEDLFSRASLTGELEARRFLREFERDFERLGPRAARSAGADRGRAARPDPAADLFPETLREFEEDQEDSEAAGAPARVEMSRLIAWQPQAGRLAARAVRQVLGLPRAALSDDEALALALDPSRNRLLGEALNLTTLHKITRALHHPYYTFLKRISHTADSQNQRHRMTPGSRPYLVAHLTGAPDYITPALIASDPSAARLYRESMERTWEAVRALRRLGAEDEWVAYLLPNAVTVRFMESADLLALRHKCQMRLCYNAQEEIWRAALEEARQIAAVHPRIGRWLAPPCVMRERAGARPYCPEGPRYCGVRVWTLGLGEYQRII